MLKDMILGELIENGDTAISGQSLAEKYGVSRNAIWKAVKALKEEGYEISSVTNKGYRLVSDNNILSGQAIRMALYPDYRNIRIFALDSIDSTNNEAKRRLADDNETGNMLIVAEEQKQGRGRYGKSFYSPRGGIYMSLVFKLSGAISEPKNFTKKAAVAVVRAIKNNTDADLEIRGINDIYYKGKKAGGILTEAVAGLETGCIEHVIVGIGLNLFTASFPEEINGRAISLTELNLSKNNLIAQIINEIIPLYEMCDDMGYVDEYEKYLCNK